MNCTRWLAFWWWVFAVNAGCGSQNYLEAYSPLEAEQQAKKALNERRWDDAIEAYKALIEVDSQRYDLYPLYATAIAGKAGVLFLDVLIQQLQEAGEGQEGASFAAAIRQIAPSGSDLSKANLLSDALDLLTQIPSAELEASSELAQGVEIQKNIYSAVHVAMTFEAILPFDADGEIDQEALEDLTVEEAVAIIESLQNAAAIGDPDNPMSAAIEEALEQIELMPGETTEEKLKEFLRENQ